MGSMVTAYKNTEEEAVNRALNIMSCYYDGDFNRLLDYSRKHPLDTNKVLKIMDKYKS
jgi:hypothetical protein